MLTHSQPLQGRDELSSVSAGQPTRGIAAACCPTASVCNAHACQDGLHCSGARISSWFVITVNTRDVAPLLRRR